MGILQVTLFGGIRITKNNWTTEIKIPREVQLLLAYLLIHRDRTRPREVVAGIFWGELSQERAHASLSNTLWKLKKVLESDGIPAGTYLVNNHPGEVGFNRESQYWLDVEVFEQETCPLLASPPDQADETNIHELERILGLYQGELLEGSYKDWALGERERLRTLYLKSLRYLLQYYRSRGLYEDGLAYGQQILNVDPLREDIHREMMRLYQDNGQRALAVRQHEVCRLALSKELGISPMEETEALYTKILTEADSHNSGMISNQQVSIDQAVAQLRQANQSIDLAKGQIQQALQLIGESSENTD
jgi:DNA-binding SARP family transcriptional activator